jgi:hypothetical protein
MKIGYFLSLILIAVLFIGCTKERFEPTITSVILPNASPTFVSTHAFTITAPNTMEPTITAIPFHPIPTPPQKDSADITLELLRTNNGCDLPCWWGIIPNQTRWSDVENFLKPFSHVFLSESPSWQVFFIRSPISKEYSELGEVRATIATQNEVVKEIEISEFDEKSYHLSSFLQKYGIPSKVLVSTYSSDYGMPPNKVPFTLALYYPDQGIMATYATDADVNGAQIEGCFTKSPTLFLWSSSENNRSIDYILGWDKDKIQYLEIKEATGLDLQTFYNLLSKENSKQCLQTPKGLWLSQ